MTKKEQRDSAFDLFLNHEFSKSKIAKTMGVSVQTISAWADEDQWDEIREKNRKIEKDIKGRVYKMIDHSLRVFEQEMDEQEKKGVLKHFDKGQIDGLSKLLAGIKSKEISFGNAVKLLTDFLTYLNTEDTVIAKRIIPHVDSFIATLRKAE